MKTILLVLFIAGFISSCNNKETEKTEASVSFNESKWKEKKDEVYPYRNAMLNDLIVNDKLKGRKYADVINLLGMPDRMDNNHLFYNINKEYLGNSALVLHTKTLVIKLNQDSIVEWRKIHE